MRIGLAYTHTLPLDLLRKRKLQMNTYLIKGADKTTGKETQASVQCEKQKTAEEWARDRGIMVSDISIQSPNGDNWVEQVYGQPKQTRLEADVHHILFWVRFWSFWGIIGIFLACIIH